MSQPPPRQTVPKVMERSCSAVQKASRDNKILPVPLALIGALVLVYFMGGGMVVIHTPGHTPGHISLFLPADHLLIAGDALRVEDGELEGPSPKATPDMSRATASLRKLLAYPIDRVFCYHGGLSKPGALARLWELAGSTIPTDDEGRAAA